MRLAQLGIFATTFGLPFFALGAVRRDLNRKNVEVAELDGHYKIDEAAQEIVFHDPGSDFEDVFRCTHRSGKRLTFCRNHQFVACCAPGQHLVGSPETAFDCCGSGHQLAGSTDVGYICCPTGQVYDGNRCHEPRRQEPRKVCPRGKDLVDGHCVCPPGTTDNGDGHCRPKGECGSGLQEGKCYVFKMENGHLLGYDNKGWYTAAEDSRAHHFGKFKLCKTQACDGRSSVDPADGFRILDIHGQANSGAKPNHWLNAEENGGHIGKTADWAKAGVFSITKWTCGKYCLGGFEHGLGPTCPSDDPALTFNTLDKQACRPVEVIEVPCDIHAVENNCIWDKTSSACGPGDSNHCSCRQS